MVSTPKAPFEIEKPKLLFVEGKDEVNVFTTILAAANVGDVQLIEVGGKDQLASKFGSATKEAGFRRVVTSIGIVQDADDNANAAFARVSAVLQGNKIAAPPTAGQFAQSASIRAGILILPGAGANGCLEDLFLQDFAGSALINCVGAFAECCQGNGVEQLTSKERAHALLVALKAPENRLGRAFQSGKVNAASQSYEILRDFVQAL